MSKIMKIIDERETPKKRTRRTEAIVKGSEINDFVERLSFSN